MSETAQDRGRQFDYWLAKRIGGERQKGSGNTIGFKLDARGVDILIEGKYTDAASFSVTEDILDKVVRAVSGPEAAVGNVESFLVVKLGPSGRPKAVIDLELLLEWMRKPPELVPATKQDGIRRTARTPTLLRGDG